jgi:protein tyrosine phosphatase (PTP) superfamily phosphohydrolase (DUF442 family)
MMSNEKQQVSTRPDFEDLGTPRAHKLCNALEQRGIDAHPVPRETLQIAAASNGDLL